MAAMPETFESEEENCEQDDHHADLFHSVVMGEERAQNRGYRDGFRLGRRSGYQEGFRLGEVRGNGVGSELGFYMGFVSVWLTLIQMKTNPASKPRVLRTLQSVASLLEKFTLTRVHNESLTEDVACIQAKFKQVMSLLGLVSKEDQDESGINLTF